MKNILVIGGAGFIGSHTCLALLEKDYKVFVFDSFVNSSSNSLKRVLEISELKNKKTEPFLKIYRGDLLNKKQLENTFKDIYENYEFLDGVIHFGGLKSVAESIYSPIEYWKTNVLGTINLLETMSKYESKHLVFSSSATIYGSSKNSFLKEDSELNPINPYGNTKLTVEKFLGDIFKSARKEWHLASLRYFNPIGAHYSGLIGECPIGKPNNIFPLITNTALGLQKELKVFGNDWPTKDGTPIRDYIHVMDLANIHIRVLEHLISNKPNYLKLNVGTGKGTSVLELIKIFERVNKVRVPYVYAKRRPGDKCSIVADNSLLISKLKISPKSSIEDMCRDGWKWKNLNPNGY
ncbi:UDP-glucose 4-epimerase GalE [uncultured Prochlorococcus sp.]|uniref:UDP-glucose 4-epimerase GalE n=1 Tax=uncultured Prochlorococcus sp. TaxID=159733 RepID=UPI00258C52AA|nr:UDP-glucose 4-epimerase GalE [uncultured Prochlorococcus sp.]